MIVPDDSEAKKRAVINRLVNGQLNPIRCAFTAWDAFTKTPEYYWKTVTLTKAVGALLHPLKDSFDRVRGWDPNVGRRALKCLLANMKRSPRNVLADWSAAARAKTRFEAKRDSLLRLLGLWANLKP
jgi:hypothetical protein